MDIDCVPISTMIPLLRRKGILNSPRHCSPAEAKELVPDLILLDFSMPGMNGAETAKILRKSVPQVRIILFTMGEEFANEALAAATGVDRVVAKPGAAYELLDCMRSVMGLSV